MVHSIASALNRMEKRPLFTKVKEPASPRGMGRGAGHGTWFGSVPDMTTEVEGVLFSDVRPGSPAAKAGLRGGDRMIRFAGKEIKNLMDFTYMLRTHKPGETVEVVVIRGGNEVTVPVTLGIRR
jgi:S1-C subfamily serine protease